ncbi:MAG: Maf family protein [Pirellulales bacterium]|nr:Maf family protein [Pirellulales bacterium]
MNSSDQLPWRLVLASRSPRRRELLREAGHVFAVCPADEEAESGVDEGLGPDRLVQELAYRKAAWVAEAIVSGRLAPFPLDSPSRLIVLGCDTVVECDGQVLGKPVDRADARRMLEALRGRRHRVVSGLCLWPIGEEEPRVGLAATTLRMDPISDGEIDEYLSGGQWRGKAGAFGYQDRTGWIHVVEGSESNVVGLPMELLATMLGA